MKDIKVNEVVFPLKREEAIEKMVQMVKGVDDWYYEGEYWGEWVEIVNKKGDLIGAIDFLDKNYEGTQEENSKYAVLKVVNAEGKFEPVYVVEFQRLKLKKIKK